MNPIKSLESYYTARALPRPESQRIKSIKLGTVQLVAKARSRKSVEVTDVF
jgi:hypothetical protein